MFWATVKNIFLDVLFPPICLNCRKHLDAENEFICDECLSLIELNHTLFCPACQARLAENKRICHKDSKYLLAAAGSYNDPILKNLILSFKYKNFTGLAPILGGILKNYLDDLFGNSKLLARRSPRLAEAVGEAQIGVGGEIKKFVAVPIPLFPNRERKRGFNQTKLLASILAQEYNLEINENLKKIKNNKPQAQCGGYETRAKNISGCFQLKNPESIRNKNIILVDDVFTSGATMNEAVRILKNAGAKKIIALVLAKA